VKLFDKIHARSITRPRRILLYGIRGIGTSTLASGLRAPVFIPTDESTNHVVCSRFPVCRRFDQIMQALQELYVEPHEYGTVVIDSLDSVELLIGDELCRARNAEHLAAIPDGQALALAQWQKLLRRLDLLSSDIGLHIVLVGHAQLHRPASAVHRGSHTQRWEPALNDQASGRIQSWCDEVLFATHANRGHGGGKLSAEAAHDHRVIYTAPARAHAAKNHLRLPPRLPMQVAALLPYLQSVLPPQAHINESARGPS
jgi:hypothetical protein